MLENCHEALPVYPRLLELTGVGPGVGVSSAECRLRMLEKARIYGTVKYLKFTGHERTRDKRSRTAQGMH